jgi:hypothetical protein
MWSYLSVYPSVCDLKSALKYLNKFFFHLTLETSLPSNSDFHPYEFITNYILHEVINKLSHIYTRIYHKLFLQKLKTLKFPPLYSHPSIIHDMFSLLSFRRAPRHMHHSCFLLWFSHFIQHHARSCSTIDDDKKKIGLCDDRGILPDDPL